MTPQEQARDLMLRLAAMKPEERNRDFSDDKKWREDFKEDLDGLLAALKDERENRQEQYTEIQNKITGIEKDQIAVRSERAVWDKLKWVLIGAAITAIIALLSSAA